MIETGGYPAMKVALTGATGYIGSHVEFRHWSYRK